MPQRKYVYIIWVVLVILVLLAAGLSWKCGPQMSSFLFVVFASTGLGFSLLLGAIFVGGMFVVIDRIVFFIFHILISHQLTRSNDQNEHGQNVFTTFLRVAREFRATSAEGIYSDEIVDHAREVALRDTIDGQEIDWGRNWLQFLGTIAPIIGFIGTLVGLIDSFQKLGLGGELTDVLKGLALSMTTSLLGAIISVIFLSTAWILGRVRQGFDATLYRTIATAQETDRLGV